VLLLDEPTNHLDLDSQGCCKDALADFEGTLLLVTHDRYLVDALATHVWAIEGNRIVAYEGTTASLSRSGRGQTPRRRRDQDGRARRKDKPKTNRRRQKRETAAQAHRRTEAAIAKHETRLSELTRQLETAKPDKVARSAVIHAP